MQATKFSEIMKINQLSNTHLVFINNDLWECWEVLLLDDDILCYDWYFDDCDVLVITSYSFSNR